MRLSALFRRCLLAVALAASLASALSPIHDADAARGRADGDEAAKSPAWRWP